VQHVLVSEAGQAIVGNETHRPTRDSAEQGYSVTPRTRGAYASALKRRLGDYRAYELSSDQAPFQAT
jgi:hypothetical protein